MCVGEKKERGKEGREIGEEVEEGRSRKGQTGKEGEEKNLQQYCIWAGEHFPFQHTHATEPRCSREDPPPSPLLPLLADGGRHAGLMLRGVFLVACVFSSRQLPVFIRVLLRVSTTSDDGDVWSVPRFL